MVMKFKYKYNQTLCNRKISTFHLYNIEICLFLRKNLNIGSPVLIMSINHVTFAEMEVPDNFLSLRNRTRRIHAISI